MCGIFCVITRKNNSVTDCYKCLNAVYEKCKININKRGPDSINSIKTIINDWNLLLAGSVLWLQGSELVKQPVETERSWFLYNGDIFDSQQLSFNLRKDDGDTRPLLDTIEKSECFITILEENHGPYAFIYVDKLTSKLYFGRDTYGRRSLLISKKDQMLLLSSVATRDIGTMMELPALGIFCFDITSPSLESLSLYPWRNNNQHFNEKLEKLENYLSLKINVHENENKLITPLYKSPTNDELLILEYIEKVDAEKSFIYLLNDKNWNKNVVHLISLLETAVERRVKNQPLFCNDCIKERTQCNHALIGILFSGGLDCAIIALIADKFIDKRRQIDLLNVAFEHKCGYETPDRLTARQTVQELERLRPERRWNLMEVNVTQKELSEERSRNIADLIFPLNSILDESLGCALWFASRGRTSNYTSPCRVLFVGMGADELFGGYTRHRAAYKRGKWEELTIELDNDWRNISHRNLARDDRVVSDHGRQLRTPYLDEDVVNFIRMLNSWAICYPSDKVIQGLGDKLLLRTAAFHLGLKQAAILRKRALQFGSRIANKNENAHDISPRLKSV